MPHLRVSAVAKTNVSANARVGWRWILIGLTAALVVTAGHGCASAPPPRRVPGEVESEERGVILSVHDTTIDATDPHNQGVIMPTGVPLGPVAVSVPVRVGGQGHREAPGEEITVKLKSGATILIVQELSEPPLAPGETVRVLHERYNAIAQVARIRIEREDSSTPPAPPTSVETKAR
jgi:hypothetical protein